MEMPTGYTAEIYDGKEVKGNDFILKCARAFGAAVLMRDEPLDNPIREFEPSKFYIESLQKERERLEEYKIMTIEQAQIEVNQSYENAQKDYYKSIEKYSELENRYTKTLREVEAWNPPSTEHYNLKEYAIDQLKSSIESDCNIKYLRLPERQDAKAWLDDMIEHCQENIVRYQKSWEEEIKRTEGRNQWTRQLKESLQN